MCVIEAEIAKKINFATIQNDIPFIQDISINNNSDIEYNDLLLELSTEPAILQPREWHISRLSPHNILPITDISVSLNRGLLADLDERLIVDVKLILKTSNGVILSTNNENTTIALAHNEWGGSRFMPELLAAFVMPNLPAVAKILREASELLRRADRTTSLEGYQSGSPRRVWEIISFIWNAVTAGRLTYIEAPASFETEGQKIRTPNDIQENGMGTCLDLAVLFASILEQVGLHPILVLTRGHALCGVWLQPQPTRDLICDDPASIRNAIGLYNLVLFETTLATGHQATSFFRCGKRGKKAAL